LTAVFWDVTLFSLIQANFSEICEPEDEVSMFLGYSGKFLPDCTVPHPYVAIRTQNLIE
jgi:hypothetical protein